MFSINDIKKMFKNLRSKKTGSEALNTEIINKLKESLDDCTKEINSTINRMMKRKNVSKAIGNLNKKLEIFLKEINKTYIAEWDFYKICQILKDVLDWCVVNNKFSQEKTTKEVINCIYTELTGKGKNSFNNDIKNLKKGKSVTLDIKMNDSSMKPDVKKSLKRFLLSLMKFCFYSEVKEFTRSEVKEFTRKEIDSNKNGDAENDAENKVSEGGTGIVRKICYTDKHNKTKTRAIKTLKSGFYIDWKDKSKGLDDEVIDFIKGSKLVEDTFKEDRQKYKERKKIIKDKENKKIDDKKTKKTKEAKNKFSNLAIQKVRTKGNEFVMISKLAEGDLSKFYYLDNSNDKNNNNCVKLDSEDKVKQLFNDLTSGVRQLHEAGLVHGDIKPKNILVYKKKNNILKYKITDFDSVVKIKNYKDNKIHTSGYVPKCYSNRYGIPNGKEAKKVDCYAICKTLREVFDNMENFGGEIETRKKLKRKALKLVSKYEKEKSCAFKESI